MTAPAPTRPRPPTRRDEPETDSLLGKIVWSVLVGCLTGYGLLWIWGVV